MPNARLVVLAVATIAGFPALAQGGGMGSSQSGLGSQLSGSDPNLSRPLINPQMGDSARPPLPDCGMGAGSTPSTTMTPNGGAILSPTCSENTRPATPSRPSLSSSGTGNGGFPPGGSTRSGGSATGGLTFTQSGGAGRD